MCVEAAAYADGLSGNATADGSLIGTKAVASNAVVFAYRLHSSVPLYLKSSLDIIPTYCLRKFKQL